MKISTIKEYLTFLKLFSHPYCGIFKKCVLQWVNNADKERVFNHFPSRGDCHEIQANEEYCLVSILLHIFRNKRSQAKGVYYVFLYKQHMDNVYTRVAIHRFTLGSLVVGRSLSSPPQSWISTLAREY